MAGRPGEEKDRELQNAIGIATEIVDLLPDGMKETASLAFQAVMLNRKGRYTASLERLGRLGRESYAREPYADFLAARNEFALFGGYAADDEAALKHISRARRFLHSYLSRDISARPQHEVDEALMMKARADYLLGCRKGIFMAIIEIPEGTEAGDLKKSVKVKGLHLSSEKEEAAVFRNGSGAVFSLSVEAPNLLVAGACCLSDGTMETAVRFIRFVHSIMAFYGASTLYINGAILTASDVEEALADISGDAFPVWFFARGSESDEGGELVLTAEGAESFGAKAVRVIVPTEADKEEAGAALSLILVYHVYSASARRSKSFTIDGRVYELASSDRNQVTNRLL